MNFIKFIAPALFASTLLAAGSASADSIDREYQARQSTPSTLTRAAVRADMVQARNGSRAVNFVDDGYPAPMVYNSEKTRTDVRLELAQAHNSGLAAELRN